MKRNYGLILTMGLVLLVSLAFAMPTLAGEEKAIKLRLAAVFPPPAQSLGSYGVQLWMDEVTKKTNGKVSFQTFWGGALGKPPEHLTLVERGMADLVLTHRWYTPGKLPLGQFEYVFPFGPIDPLVVSKAKRQIFEEFPDFRKNLAKYNALLVMNTSACAYQILSKTPLRSLDDFKGKKLRERRESCIARYRRDYTDCARGNHRSSRCRIRVRHHRGREEDAQRCTGCRRTRDGYERNCKDIPPRW